MTSKNTPAKTTTADIIDDVEVTTEGPKTPTHVNGIYTEYGVELSNGVKVDIEVITDHDNLPASFMTYAAEGNTLALMLAKLTPNTRRILDFLGATQKDLRTVIADVISRANEVEDD